jgi:Hemerythrin HHE cation binding domain
MEDVFDVLAEDHEEIRQALAELEKGPTAATGATEDQLMLRKIMTEELVIEAAKHEEIELTLLWPAVRAHVPGGDRLADLAICQELGITALLAELDQLDASQPEFENLLTRFTAAGREHFDFEERHVWPRLRSALNSGALNSAALNSGALASGAAKAADELGRKILLARQSGATRPALPAPREPAPPGESAHYGTFG